MLRNMSREQSSLALLLLAGVTASVLVTTIWWRKRRKDAPPKKWRRVGEVSEIALFPLKSGKGIELQEAQCTTAGLVTTDNVDPTLRHLADRILVIYDSNTKEYVTCRRFTQTLHISVTSGGMGTVLLNAPGMPEFKLVLPEKGDVLNCVFWKRENVPMIDCGDEVADWLNKYLHQDKMRLGYKSPPVLKQHRKSTADPWKPFTKVFTQFKDDYMGIFTDLASYMIMTEESVEELNSRLSEKVPAKQFRPNFMVKGTVPHDEDSWSWVKIGDHIVLKIFMPCTRCMITTVNPVTAVRHPQMEPVKTLKTYGTRCKMGFILTQIPHIVDEVVEFKNWIMKKKGYPCPFEGCKAVLSRPGRLADHMHTHTGELPYKCNVPGCTKGYNSKSSLRRHLQESHEGKATLYTTLLRCPHPSCMRLLSSRFNLQRHYQRLHANQSKFMCQYCDKGFKTQTQLQRHVYHHTGIPPLRCPTCSAGFVTERDLNRHQRGHRKWVCEVNDCGRVFLHWKTYRKHLSVDHSGVFQCDECKKTFRTKNAVRLHVACHLDDDDRPVLNCPYENCERFYFHKKNLKQHILFWHEEKGFNCKECGKKLSTNAKLKQHMLMHAPQERPVQPKKRTLPRKKRKDAGIPHQSMAAKLSGATIPHEEEKLLIRSEYESTIEVDPFAETGVTTYSTCLAAKQRASAKRKDILDVDSEKLKQGSKDDDFKDFLASASSGTIMSGSDCVHAHDEVHKISDIENGKESSECDVDPSVLEQTSNMLNGKNNDTQKNEKEEPGGSDNLCKNKKEALDENVAMDAFHGQNHEKVFLAHLSDVWQFSGGILPLVALHDSEVVVPSLSQNSSNGAEMPSATVLMYQEYRQVYNLKKWVLVMTGMMELLCPVVCSESPSRASNTP